MLLASTDSVDLDLFLTFINTDICVAVVIRLTIVKHYWGIHGLDHILTKASTPTIVAHASIQDGDLGI